MYAPAALNCWIRSLSWSATKTDPSGPTAIPAGWPNSAGPLPLRPHDPRTAPDDPRWRIFWSSKATTYSEPSRATAIPVIEPSRSARTREFAAGAELNAGVEAGLGLPEG